MAAAKSSQHYTTCANTGPAHPANFTRNRNFPRLGLQPRFFDGLLILQRSLHVAGPIAAGVWGASSMKADAPMPSARRSFRCSRRKPSPTISLRLKTEDVNRGRWATHHLEILGVHS